MYKWIAKLDRGLERIERIAAVGLYTLLIGLICINILARNILHWTSDALLELSPTVVLWLCLVGAGLALKYHRHIKIELLLRFLPPTGRRLATGLTRLFAMVICGSLAWASVIFVCSEITLRGQRGWLAVCFPLFFSVACFRFGCDFLRQWGLGESEEP
jgi:TRAP-type C4-dicarboxylate transport system permease small subunit